VPHEHRSIVDFLSSTTVVPLGILQSSGAPRMSQAECLARTGAACPHCNSPEISGGGLSARIGSTKKSVWGCESGWSEWITTFCLSGFIAGTHRRGEAA
jgi:hypothetical protein